MEPDSYDSPYGHLIQPPPGEEEPGPDPLEAIVARARRRGWRLVAGIASATLVVGGAAGFLIAGNGSSPSTGGLAASASTPPTTAGGIASSSTGGLYPWAGGNFSLTHLFTRTSGTITVRGFEIPTPEAECTAQFQAEVSTPAMVGTASNTPFLASTSGAVTSMASNVIGQAEGDPVLVVIVSTSHAVGSVSASFVSGATDQMAPVKGWAALVTHLTKAMDSAVATAPQKSLGTLVATDGSGKVLQRETIAVASYAPSAPSTPCMAPACPSAVPTTTTLGTTGSGLPGTQATPCTRTPPIPGQPLPMITVPTCPPRTMPVGQAWACVMSPSAKASG